jgi:predicted DNA-binding transcriptional regulator YafY
MDAVLDRCCYYIQPSCQFLSVAHVPIRSPVPTAASAAFSRIEIEALMLGLAEVRQMGDPALAAAAQMVLGKVAATLPPLGQQHLLHAVSQVHRFEERYPKLPDMHPIREACWREQALVIGYTHRKGSVTTGTIWPLALVYLDRRAALLREYLGSLREESGC